VKTYKDGPVVGLNRVVPKYTFELRWRQPPSMLNFNLIELSTRRVDSTGLSKNARGVSAASSKRQLPYPN
jgi:hypothetical protein